MDVQEYKNLVNILSPCDRLEDLRVEIRKRKKALETLRKRCGNCAYYKSLYSCLNEEIVLYKEYHRVGPQEGSLPCVKFKLYDNSVEEKMKKDIEELEEYLEETIYEVRATKGE